MWPSRRQTPIQLAGAAVWGVVLSTLALYLALVLHDALDLGRKHGLIRIGIALAPVLAVFGVGAALGWRAVSLLCEGICLERWQAQEVEFLRKWVDRPIWTVAVFLLLGLVALAALFTPRYPIFYCAWMFLFMPMNLILRLRRPFHRPDNSPLTIFGER